MALRTRWYVKQNASKKRTEILLGPIFYSNTILYLRSNWMDRLSSSYYHIYLLQIPLSYKLFWHKICTKCPHMWVFLQEINTLDSWFFSFLVTLTKKWTMEWTGHRSFSRVYFYSVDSVFSGHYVLVVENLFGLVAIFYQSILTIMPKPFTMYC